MRGLLAGVAKVGAGVAAGQLIVVLASPIVSRLFDPSDFGTYSIIVSIAAVLTVIFSGRLDLAVATALSDRQSRDAAMLGSIYLTLGAVAVAVAISIALAAGTLESGKGIVGDYFLIPLLLVAAGLFDIFSAYLIRRGRYRQAAWRSITLNGSLAASQIGLGALSVPGGLSLGYLLSRIVGATYSARAGGLRLSRDWRGLRRSGIRNVAEHTAHFPRVVTPASLLNALGTQAPVLLFGLLLGPVAAGLLGFTQRILSAPASLLGQSLAQVYTAESAASLRREAGQPRALFVRTSLLLLVAAASLGVLIYLLSPLLFEPVFGPDWAEAGLISQALSVGVAAQLLVVPLSQTMIVHGKHRAQLLWDISRLVLIVAVILVAFSMGGDARAITWAFSLASAAAYAVLWMLCLHAVSSPRGEAK